MISCECTVDCKILFKPNKPADEWLSSQYEVYSLGQLGNKLSLAAYFCIFLLQRAHCAAPHPILHNPCPRPIATPSMGPTYNQKGYCLFIKSQCAPANLELSGEIH